MSDFNLDAFLAAQSAQGKSEGEGDFTISHEKARAKLTRYSLPREYSWVLKLIQAAVGWGCAKLVVSQTRTDSTFRFQLDDPTSLPSNEELVTALLRSDFDSPRAIDRLGTALRLVVERAHLSFYLMVDRGVGEAQAIYAGVYFTELGEKRREKMRADWGPGVTLMIHHVSHTEPNRLLLSYIPIKRHGLPMLREIEEYAYVSPVTIRVDGRWIDGALRSSVLNWTLYRKPLRMRGLEIRASVPMPNLSLCEGFGDRTFTVQTSARRANRKEYDRLEAPAFYIIGIEKEKSQFEMLQEEYRAEIHWVCDGVIVQSEKIPTKTINVSVSVYVNAAGLNTDLTSFHLVESPEFVERRAAVFEALAVELLSEMADERDIFADDVDERWEQDVAIELDELKQRRKTMAKKVAWGSLVAAPLTGPIAPGTLLTGLAASAYVASREVKLPEVNWETARLGKRYRRELETLATTLLAKSKRKEDEE